MRLPRGAMIFVSLVFTFLYATFLVLPYMLWREYGVTDALGIGLFHSYLFVFYPVFGLVGLVAFFRPAVIFTDFYWHHVERFGRLRYIFGFIVVLATSAFFTMALLESQPRAVWEMASAIPSSASTVSSDCKSDGSNCNAGPLLSPMFAVRAASRERIGLRPFARGCTPDKLLELPEVNIRPRQCFVSTPPRRLSAAECCKAQKIYEQQLHARYIDLDQVKLRNWEQATDIDLGKKSMTGHWHAATLYFKTFFILTMIVIALLLVVWQESVVIYYAPLVPKMDRGMIVGALVMLFWPLMEYAYGQSSGVLLGSWEPGFKLKYSLVVLPWALIVGLYFLRRHGAGIFSQVMSVVGVVFAAFQQDMVTNLAVRFVGSGAGWFEGLGLIGLAVAALVVVLWPSKIDLDTDVTAPGGGGSGRGSSGGKLAGTGSPATSSLGSGSPGSGTPISGTAVRERVDKLAPATSDARARPPVQLAGSPAPAPAAKPAPVAAPPNPAPKPSAVPSVANAPVKSTPVPAAPAQVTPTKPSAEPNKPDRSDPLKGPFRS